MTITFCGHGNVANITEVHEWLYTTAENLILEGAKTFYLGGYGEFDSLSKSVLRELKNRYSHIDIVLILPYLNSSINADGYCYTLYPPIETVPKRFAIIKRNEWMVEQADITVAYVTHGFGGAAKTLEFAKRKKKKIIIYPQMN